MRRALLQAAASLQRSANITSSAALHCSTSSARSRVRPHAAGLAKREGDAREPVIGVDAGGRW